MPWRSHVAPKTRTRNGENDLSLGILWGARPGC